MHRPALPVHLHHPRRFRGHRHVYPVVSRRSGGVSIGINLSPGAVCNFRCVYCQVDRTHADGSREVELSLLVRELAETVALVRQGDLFRDPAFAQVPPALRSLRDLAFSGDGEPTASPHFLEAVRVVTRFHEQQLPSEVRIVLLTNASLLHEAPVQAALDTLAVHSGEIWGKLDAGSPEHYARVNRTAVPYARILENLCFAARRYVLRVQSLFLELNGRPPAEAEIEAYLQRLREISQGGGAIRSVQVYTVAREAAEPGAIALDDAALDAIAARVRDQTGLPVEVSYGARAETGSSTTRKLVAPGRDPL
jgi:wyosine [tRNA(Phe)-imidazoG37] synthetase (radical SAM superfamily)